ncbi:MAG: prepilin-type N-terminal cleavage/methylation domain-containing protein [Patescibacteria group bacterium]
MSIFKRTGKGFTLIELLVVIAIIGILSSVVLASLNDARMKSRDAKRIADLKQLQLALELFFDGSGAYPTYAQYSTSGTGNLTPQYMATLPKDPTANVIYTYVGLAGTGTACTSYHIGAGLEQTGNQVLNTDTDGAPGTACTGGVPVGGADFNGNSVASGVCSGATAATPDPCYDIKP